MCLRIIIYYIKNIKVDLTKKSIIEARKLAEDKAKLIGFASIIDRSTKKTLKIKKKDIKLNITCSPFFYNFGLYLEKTNIKIPTKTMVFIGIYSVKRYLISCV